MRSLPIFSIAPLPRPIRCIEPLDVCLRSLLACYPRRQSPLHLRRYLESQKTPLNLFLVARLIQLNWRLIRGRCLLQKGLELSIRSEIAISLGDISQDRDWFELLSNRISHSFGRNSVSVASLVSSSSEQRTSEYASLSLDEVYLLRCFGTWVPVFWLA